MSHPAAGPKPATVLVVLDGWGIAPPAPDNAIHLAATPHWDRLWATAPRTCLGASGASVGLPAGQMGNSEVGHMTMGAGRTIHQDLTRIDRAIDSGEFQANETLNAAIDGAGGALHVLGLLSPGGVHSHETHIAALLQLAASSRPALPVRLHAFLDGRDTPPRSALESLCRIEARFPGVVASICGRYYAMDRDGRWDRTERAWRLVQCGQAPFAAATAPAALQAAYERGESDEFVQPTLVRNTREVPTAMQEGDSAVFMNFRADRARQLAQALTAPDFGAFGRPARVRFAVFATLARYAENLPLPVAFPLAAPSQTLGECVAAAGGTQLRLAETEKYAHVTYFLSGGREEPFAGEERVLVPSPAAATYDQTPAMSADAVTDRLVAAIEAGRHDLVVCNYANGDMVGHTGVLDAAVRAVEAVDTCLGRLLGALAATGAQCLVTADHGNVERMADHASGQPHTAHTAAEVPLVYAGPRSVRLRDGGTLADVAPTLLTLLGLPQPRAMTGRSLVGDAASMAAG